MPEPNALLLQVDSVVAGYGKRTVVKGVSLQIAKGQVVALIGHNGAGKSTLLKAIFALIPSLAGVIALNGKPIKHLTPRMLIHEGVAYVPQGNRVFTELSVSENLELGGVALANKQLVQDGIEKSLFLFPRLRELLNRRAGTLSGGEKQMLALANALIASPRLLLLDEPSLGLAAPLVASALNRIHQLSRKSNLGVLIVEQKVREVLKIADYVYVLRNGCVSFSGSSAELADESKLREVYL